MSSFNEEIYAIANAADTQGFSMGVGAQDNSTFVIAVIEHAVKHKLHFLKAHDFGHSIHFREVDKPMRGDIAYWAHHTNGHVGIILEPFQHMYIAAESSGGVFKTHWSRHPKFLRYVG